MAVTFPRPMPDHGIMDCAFDIERVDLLSPEQGGKLGALTAGFPLWHMKLQLQNMDVFDGDIWCAWVDGQRGAQRLLLAYDAKRPVPRYHAGGIPFTRNPAGWSQTIDAGGSAVLTLTGVMAGTVLSNRDYIGFEWGGTKRALVRVIEGGAANSAGMLAVTIEPAVPAPTPSNALVNLNRPTCLMRLVSAETTPPALNLDGYYPAGGTIRAIQEIVP